MTTTTDAPKSKRQEAIDTAKLHLGKISKIDGKYAFEANVSHEVRRLFSFGLKRDAERKQGELFRAMVDTLLTSRLPSQTEDRYRHLGLKVNFDNHPKPIA